MPAILRTPTIGIWKMEETSEEMFSMIDNKELYTTDLSQLKAEQRKKEWLGTRLLLKDMLGFETTIFHQSSGAPYLSSALKKNISISHTKGYVAIMLSEGNHLSGIDIEYRSDRVLKVRKRFMNPEEEEFINSLYETEHLLICWCAKETLYKIINRQEVDFCRHLHIQPFSYSKNGVFTVYETHSSQRLSFELMFQVKEDYVITWLKNK